MRGTTIKRGRTWSVVLDVGRDENGKRKQRWEGGFRTKSEAEKRLSDLLREVQRGTYIDSGRVTVDEWLHDWLDGRRSNIADSTYATTRIIIDARISPKLGFILLRELKAPAIASLYADLLKSGRSSKTALNTHRVLSQALKAAVKIGLIAVNPCDVVEAPRPPRYIAEIPTSKELAAILAAADATRFGPLVRLAVLTGAREGELLGAVWSDVDLDGQRWHIRGTKTRGSRRTIELGADAVDLLRAHRQAQRERGLLFGAPMVFAGDSARIFTTEVGTPLSRHNLSRREWKRIIEAARVRPFRFHDLRHAAASLLIGAGVPLPVVSQRLGHTRVSTTSDVYAHLLPRQGEQAAALLEDLVAGRRSS
jgi:integrase